MRSGYATGRKLGVEPEGLNSGPLGLTRFSAGVTLESATLKS
jgi:hypothetical protein